MSDVIDFIESLGAQPAISPHRYAVAIERLAVDDATREALLGRDAAALGVALGGRDVMWCAIRSPDESPEEETPRREDPVRDDPQPEPDED